MHPRRGHIETHRWTVGCGGVAGPLTTGGVTGSYVVHVDSHPVPDGAVVISKNVYRN